MKQTVGILLALAVALLAAMGLMVSANIDQSRAIDLYKDEVNTLQGTQRKLEKEIARYQTAEEASETAMQKVMNERDALSQQLNDAVTASQAWNDALEQQKRQNEKQLREMEALKAEYEDLSEACNALEASVRRLNEDAVKAAANHEAQSLEDAKRILQLEMELEKAVAAASGAFAQEITVSPAPSYAGSEQSAKEPSDMMIDIPAQPDEGPVTLPTPDASTDNQSAQPDEGPAGLPTPQVTPQQPVPVPQVTLCPLGYSRGIVQNGQTFTDLLLQHNVSWQAMRLANPTLSTTRIAPGTRYCIPPAGSRRLCPSGTDSYVMGQFEDLNTLSELFGVAPGVFLSVNTQLAPGDFTAGRVVCVP